jgi:membrane-associated protease RseP (regulator of RpoE activity)
LLVPEAPEPKPTQTWINLLLFILTVISVLVSGGLSNLQSALPKDPVQVVLLILQNGWPFAVSLLTILGIHEFGHYFAGKAHGVKVTLPFFIPMPLSQLGTMGAFISMKSAPKNKRALMDIGVAGPLAGFIASLVVLWIGLGQSTVSAHPHNHSTGAGYANGRKSLIYLFFKYLHFGTLLLNRMVGMVSALLLYWLRYFFTGQSLSPGYLDVTISPVPGQDGSVFWITSLNLITCWPIGWRPYFPLLFGQNSAKKLLPKLSSAF